MVCDHVTGEFHCRPGYVGHTCEHACGDNTYGQDCVNTCDCHSGDCHPVTGKTIFIKIWANFAVNIIIKIINEQSLMNHTKSLNHEVRVIYHNFMNINFREK